MNSVMLASSHASATGILAVIVGLAGVAALLLYLVVDRRSHTSRRERVEGKVQ